MSKVVWLLCGCAFMATACLAADWPQYGGPDRTNISAETGLPRTFPAGGPKLLWTTEVGAGYGGAAIQDSKVYILDRNAGRSDVLRCLDLETGKDEWSYSYPAPGKVSHDGSRSVPSVDDKYVFTVGCFGQVCCVSKQTHKPVWSKNIMKDFGDGVKLPMWGYSQSPLLYKDVVIIAPQTDQAGLVALEKATGKERWRSEPVGTAHYVSPVVRNIGGVDQAIIVNKDGASAVDAATGKKLWNFSGWTCKISIPNVTSIGDGRVVITGGYTAGTVMIKVSQADGKWQATELWRNDKINSQMNPALLYKDHLYINANSNEASEGLMCVGLDGKILWQTGEKPNFERGHTLLVDGMLYIIEGKLGSLHLVELSPDGYKEVGKVGGLLGGKEIWGPLSVCGTKLIIRDQSKMLCLDLAKGQ
jgi:outer membrane protein assembly factor BamB